MIDDTSQEFINRHIGPSKKDQSKMLEYIDKNSLQHLIKDTVPENILLKNELNISHSLSESEALKKLNKLGYGYKKDLVINLVYNPQGAILPPNQLDLEKEYKKILKEEHGIIFNNLYLITNMPIARFGSTLITKNEFNPYMKLLKNNFNEEALNHLMCKSLISIDYEGYIYDCDFNQMLRINLSDNIKKHISMLSKINILDKINVADHCYGCTAGSGSSCGGVLL